jgi:DNA polymerase-3 subunit epsilon
MREVVFDTETTGLDPRSGHRLVEVGCVELMNHLPTGQTFQRYVNPERDVPDEVFKIHGLSADFLAKHATFASVAEPLLAFMGDAPLIIHNADFDMGFLNAELMALGMAPVPRERAIDTVAIARRRFPGSPASLDALCKRFAIDASARSLHGALLDATLLAHVYAELIGAREPGLELAVAAPGAAGSLGTKRAIRSTPPPHAPSPDELRVHEEFLAKLTKPIWSRPE